MLDRAKPQVQVVPISHIMSTNGNRSNLPTQSPDLPLTGYAGRTVPVAFSAKATKCAAAS
jgi:hypothetical protein